MEARGRSRKSTRRINATHQIRVWMSMVLTAVMIIGNMATSVNTVSAATPAPREEFQIRAKDIQKAAEKALDKGEAISKEILISGKDENVVKEYEKLFAADGKLYELNLTKETGTVKGVDGVDLRVFMRLPEEADPKTHVLNGEEELYFVYINDGEESVSARLNIDGLLSGFSTIRAYEAVFGEAEEKAEGSAAGGSGSESGSAEEGFDAGDSFDAEDSFAVEDISGTENSDTENRSDVKEVSGAENAGNGASGESGNLNSEEVKQESESKEVNPDEGTEAISQDEESEKAGQDEENEAVSPDEEGKEAGRNEESKEASPDGEDKAEDTAAAESREKVEAEVSDNHHFAENPEESAEASEEGKADKQDKQDDNYEESRNEGNKDNAGDSKGNDSDAGGSKGNDSDVSGSKGNDSDEGDSKGNSNDAGDSKGSDSKVSSDKESSHKDDNRSQESEKSAAAEKKEEKTSDKAEAGDKSGGDKSASDKDKSSGSDNKAEKDSSKGEKSGESKAKEDNASSGNDHKEDSKSENSSAKEVSISSLQISMHQILRVAEPENSLEDVEETSEVEETEAETEEETETEAEEISEEETEAEAEEVSEEETETKEVSEAETEVETEEVSETEIGEEIKAEVQTGTDAGTEVKPEETETTSEFEEETWEEEELAETENGQVPVEEADPFKKRGVLEGKILNLVSFEDGLTARAFVTTLEKLGMNKEDLVEGGHILTYTISPAGSAVVVNAPELVRDESEVIFGVTPQVGYRVFEVTANGEALEKVNKENLASDSNAVKENEEYVKEDTEYFRIPSVLESQDIEITLKEITEGTHPTFRESKTINGVTVKVSAGENILPEGTYLTVEEVTEKVEEAVKENVKAEKGTEVQTVIAYDINLMLDGKKLSNASWSGNYVDVEFSGERIEELKQNGESIEVAPLETPTQIVEAADGEVETLPLLEDVTAEDIRVNEDEVTQIQEDEGDSIQVRAEHFTVYVIVSSAQTSININATAKAKMYCQSNDEQDVQIGNEYYLQYGESDVNFGDKTDKILLGDIRLNYNETEVTVNNVYYMNNDTPQEVSYFKRISTTSGWTTTYTIRAYSADDKQVAVFASGTGSNTGTDNSNDFYWITNEPGHRVEWYINGKLDKVTFVADNQKPTPPYADGEPETTRGVLYSVTDKNKTKPLETLNFEGWSKRPNSNQKDEWKAASQLETINSNSEEPVRYYAIFTYDTLFYVHLPQKSPQELGPESYMYVGPYNYREENKNSTANLFGKVVVPDRFGEEELGGARWYNGTEQLKDITLLFVENIPNTGETTGELVKAAEKGVKLAYPEYDSEKDSYTITWTTLTVSTSSQGYYHKKSADGKKVLVEDTIYKPTILHVDGELQLNLGNKVTINYVVAKPDGTVGNTSVMHLKDDEIPLNSTVKTPDNEGNYTTDGYKYPAVIIQDGIRYHFRGWYTEQSYEHLADEKLIVTESRTFYARYVPEIGSISVKKILKDGTIFNSAKVEDVKFQLYQKDKSDNYIKFGNLVAMTGTGNTDTDGNTKWGTFEFSDLMPGTYYLHEEQTTAGYKLLEDYIEITVIADNNGTVTFTFAEDGSGKWKVSDTGTNVLEVTNEPAYTAVLPDTGGPGLGLIKEFGWVLLLLALMMAGMEVQYYGERRKRIQVDEI